jgi:uncharacterized protein YjbJ (UPF0337 family)
MAGFFHNDKYWFLNLNIMEALNINPINSIQVIGNWKEFKEKLKQKFADLTDHDFLQVTGKEDVLVGRLQIKSGKRREEIINIINDLQAS